MPLKDHLISLLHSCAFVPAEFTAVSHFHSNYHFYSISILLIFSVVGDTAALLAPYTIYVGITFLR